MSKDNQSREEIQRQVRWLETLPWVNKVTSGKTTQTRHNISTGSIRVGGKIGGANGYKAKAHFKGGIQDLYIYTVDDRTPEQIEQAIRDIPKETPIKKEEEKTSSEVYVQDQQRVIGEIAADKGLPYDVMHVVTPELVVDWLTTNKHNRVIDARTVERFASDMKAGDWNSDSPQGIIFHKDPFKDLSSAFLLDGQHRLHAVLEAMIPIRMKVSVNVPMSVQTVLDNGKRRTDADTYGIISGANVNAKHTAVARALMPQVRNGSRALALKVLDTHFAQIDTAVKLILQKNVRGLSNAKVGAVVVRAQYHLPIEIIERFARVLVSGVPERPGDNMVVLLRNLMTGISGKKFTPAEIYAKTERALKAMSEGQEVKYLYAADKELFPLPEEQA